MVAVLIAALIFWAGSVFGGSRVPGSLLGFLTLTIVLMGRDVVDGIRGVRCPYCGDRAMARVATRPFGYRYYRCPRCEARRKRGWAGPWADANDSQDEAIFARRKAEGRWEPGPDLEFGPDPGSTTQGRLLRGKWERRMANPHESAPDLFEPEKPATSPGVSSLGTLPPFKPGSLDSAWDVEP